MYNQPNDIYHLVRFVFRRSFPWRNMFVTEAIAELDLIQQQMEELAGDDDAALYLLGTLVSVCGSEVLAVFEKNEVYGENIVLLNQYYIWHIWLGKKVEFLEESEENTKIKAVYYDNIRLFGDFLRSNLKPSSKKTLRTI